MNTSILALILAAGEGKRMKSRQSKVMQPVGGKPMLVRILETLGGISGVEPAVIYGHMGDSLKAAITPDYPQIKWVEQREQLGTGHAVQQAQALISEVGTVLVLLGDVPLIRRGTIEQLCAQAQQSGFAVLSAKVENPFGYGRIVRDDQGRVLGIVEEKDATDEQRQIQEINSGIMAFSAEVLQRYLPKLNNNNAQGEYYLTDLVALCAQDGQEVVAKIVDEADEVMGVNNRRQLAEAENVLRRRAVDALFEAGVTLIDPSRIDVHGSVQAGKDVIIEANVLLKGEVVLGDGVVVEAGCVLEDCVIGDETLVRSHSCIEKSTIGKHASIGPFARIRPNTALSDRARIGNFVETKNAVIGEGSKVNHLSYIGDAEVGAGVNIGAGTITCNYDGVNKFKTKIADGVFIGSNSALVAPIEIGEGATVGAGSTLSKNVSAQSLALTRAPVREISGWQKPKK
ncbi:bifunctional UDP-N-acetylglucosamine diphosphorylase/glucosamine-1-phosphate N-acetyltransferase GlmU [Cardiobacteriaceae bacterium TAE3-ERU3]|nr:bifunctional UDP-N-acetylglucosamine diphosphorylase/glucosamine-1-phosphate N-acetyltransferase GlmU [Cardiobacteriaceae bacterium TAE3-ERU3]